MSAGGTIVHWLEGRASAVPAHDLWLAGDEARVMQGFRFPKRRDDWRLGRWAAKLAVAAYLGLESDSATLARIEIRPADSGAPQVFLPDGPAPVSISISHCNGIAACAVTGAGVALGCDLEAIESRSDAFVADYFLPVEQEMVARSSASERAGLVNLLWSAKESALKALQEGLRLDTRTVEVRPELRSRGHEWRRLTVVSGERQFRGWWSNDGERIRTLVSNPFAGRPVVHDLQPGETHERTRDPLARLRLLPGDAFDLRSKRRSRPSCGLVGHSS